MLTKEISRDDSVMFSDDVVRRLGHTKAVADARGLVLEVAGSVAKVDFQGTWTKSEDGSTVRHVPVANLSLAKQSKVL